MLLPLLMNLGMFDPYRGDGAGGGNWAKKQRRKRFIMPDGSTAWATKEEIEYCIALWRELNPEEEVKKEKTVKRKKYIPKNSRDDFTPVEFEPLPKPKPRAMRVSGIRFNEYHQSYESILEILKKKRDEDEVLTLILESL